MAEVSFTVYGTPAPQGSKRAFVGKSGKAHVIESSHDRVKSWRQAVVDEAVKVTSYMAAPVDIGGLGMDDLFRGPLEVEMIFYFKRPKSHFRTGRNAHLLRDAAPAYPSGKPDLSKLARATEDALTDAGVWADDAQVIRYSDLAKYWCAAPYILPGAIMRIREIETIR